jgi:hypothetical protein
MYLGGSYIGASRATFLAPAIEVMHSFGGRGLTENYLGTDHSDNGTGSLWSLGFEYAYSLRALLQRYRPNRVGWLHGGDIGLRWFGMYTYVNSRQDDPNPALNRNQRAMFKWGIEPLWQILPWVQLSLRYDRVIRDLGDDENSFRVVSPRLTIISPHWYLGAQMYFQYSHYSYGARVMLRPGQVALETVPDSDVFKIQAQIQF